MSDFSTKLAARIKGSNGYIEASNSLFGSYVLWLTGTTDHIEREEVKKLITSAQVFYKSSDEKIRNEGAIILSILLDICADQHPDLVPIARNIFTNAGDFPNVKLLSKRHPSVNFSYNFYSEAQMDFRERLNTIDDLDFPLTDYQRSLWVNLSSDEDIITVAPTSAGKTHIILSYLLKGVSESEGAFAAIVVPTRALISEVAGKLYKLAQDNHVEDDIEICSVPKEGEFGKKTFFVMTQERLYELLQRGDIYFNYLFIDEAHNISDKSRGVLLHLTIEKLLEDSFPQVIISMPAENYQDAFSTIFGDIEFKKEITQHSPVSKILISVRPKGTSLVISRHNSENVKIIPKGFKKKNLADIVYKLGQGHSNIIYRNKTDDCENVADEIAKLIPGDIDNELLDEAADYVEKFVHSDFSLAKNLRKGVAFHYGPLPSSIRIMVENLAKDDHIKFIACTSTLAEGVNLPAKNLFLKNPIQPIMHQPSERVEDVKINNITGRAGRMLQHFSGNVFLIEPDIWQFEDYFDDEQDKEEKIPTYFKTLNEDLVNVISALQGAYSHDEENQYRYYMISNKLIKEYARDELNKTFNAHELQLSGEDLALLENEIKKAYGNLRITPYTLEASPMVGYIQQNKLFNYLNSLMSFDAWLLPHPKSIELYDSLIRVCGKLQEFGIYTPSENYPLNYICLITKKWIKGKGLKDIITEQINWNRANNEQPTSINTSVRNVIKVINNDIIFRLSNALRCYQILLTMVLSNKGIELSSVKLHSFIEVGACDDRIISLINFGLSREAAIEIDDVLPKGLELHSANSLLELYHAGRLSTIHPITKKELLKLLASE
ncbi:DEAD/DEAH box helicase [Aeromonas veronii]